MFEVVFFVIGMRKGEVEFELDVKVVEGKDVINELKYEVDINRVGCSEDVRWCRENCKKVERVMLVIGLFRYMLKLEYVVDLFLVLIILFRIRNIVLVILIL